MLKRIGVVMGILLALAACGGATLRTKVFNQSENWPVPAGVTRIELATGYGAQGEDAGEYYVEQYDRYYYNKQTERSTGFVVETNPVYDGIHSGSKPGDFCGPVNNIPSGTYSTTQTCFTHIDSSYWDSYDATTGASATGFGRAFPGSTGDVAPNTTQHSNITVTPGQTYPVVIPSGGRITITYYE